MLNEVKPETARAAQLNGNIHSRDIEATLRAAASLTTGSTGEPYGSGGACCAGEK